MEEGSPEAGVETPAVDLNEGSSAAKTPGKQALGELTASVSRPHTRECFLGDFGYDGIQRNGGCS